MQPISFVLDDKHTITSPFKLRHMLPMQLRDYYRYMGSLTTPPCHETVKWTVFRDLLYMSEEQVRIGDNQPLHNGSFILILAIFQFFLCFNMFEFQLQKLRSVYIDTTKTEVMVDNWRPPQPLNGRTVYISFDVKANSSPAAWVSSCLVALVLCVHGLAL